jgi:hypothetical protein
MPTMLESLTKMSEHACEDNRVIDYSIVEFCLGSTVIGESGGYVNV